MAVMATQHYAQQLSLRRAAAGLTQRQLAEASGVKQPLISALERGVRSPTAAVRDALDSALQVRPYDLLHAARAQVWNLAREAGVVDVRVFGSVASGTDTPGSDVDLLMTFPDDADIVTLLTLEDRISELLTVPVDIVSAGSDSSLVRRVRNEAVRL